MLDNATHYKASGYPLGEFIAQDTCRQVSAGHPEHKYTTGTAWPMIMEEFEKTPTPYQRTRDAPLRLRRRLRSQQ